MVPLLSLVHRAPAGPTTTRVAVVKATDPAAVLPVYDRAAPLGSLADGVGAGAMPAAVTSAPAAPGPSTTATSPSFRPTIEAAVYQLTSPPTKAPSTTTPVTVRPKPAAPPTTRPAPPPPPPPPPANQQSGVASWLDTIPTGTCANNAAPMDAILTVTDTATGASVTCQVVSRGPYGPNRVVDLAKATFALLAPPSQGLVNVRVTW